MYISRQTGTLTYSTPDRGYSYCQTSIIRVSHAIITKRERIRVKEKERVRTDDGSFDDSWYIIVTLPATLRYLLQLIFYVRHDFDTKMKFYFRKKKTRTNEMIITISEIIIIISVYKLFF